MTEIKPFTGLRYDTQKAGLMETLVAPPYDVVNKKERDALVDSNPFNIFSVELPDASACPGENDAYQCAASILSAWVRTGILKRDRLPSLYIYDIDFKVASRQFCRHGFIGLVKLADWDERSILPHERTFDRVTEDRLKLTVATRSQFSPIFMLYRHNDRARELLASTHGEDLCRVTDPSGNMHRMSAITDSSMTASVTDALKESSLYIADGHHRYTTALRYRDRMRKKIGNTADSMPFNYIMTYLVDADDPGLIVLPTHRIVQLGEKAGIDSLWQRASQFFDIITVLTDHTDAADTVSAVEKNLAKYSDSTAVGVVTEGKAQVWHLKKDMIESAFSRHLQPAMKQLDVVLLEDVILKNVLRFDKNTEEKNVRFSADAVKSIQNLKPEQILFVMRPTPVHQVLDIADQGLTMPHKSTFFYPKILTGMVMNSLSA